FPWTRLRRECQKRVRISVPAHEGPAEHRPTKREVAEFAAGFSTGLVEAPRLEDVGNRTTARRDRRRLKQRSRIGERSIRRTECLPGVEDADPRGEEVLGIALDDSDVRILNLEEVFG